MSSEKLAWFPRPSDVRKASGTRLQKSEIIIITRTKWDSVYKVYKKSL
jgi:hypothetical protein